MCVCLSVLDSIVVKPIRTYSMYLFEDFRVAFHWRILFWPELAFGCPLRVYFLLFNLSLSITVDFAHGDYTAGGGTNSYKHYV